MSDLHHMVSVHIITPLKSARSLLPKEKNIANGEFSHHFNEFGNQLDNEYLKTYFFIERSVHLKTIIFQICQK